MNQVSEPGTRKIVRIGEQARAEEHNGALELNCLEYRTAVRGNDYASVQNVLLQAAGHDLD
jgi:hypothetical protein